VIRGREGTAGVLKPRPCPRVFVLGIVVSVLMHLALLGYGWWNKPAFEAPQAQRMSVRLLSRPTVAAIQPRREPAKATPTQRTPRVAPRKTPAKAADVAQAAQPEPVAAPVVVAAATPMPVEPISGAAFGMPTIAFPGLGASARRSSAPAPEMPMPPPMLTAQSQAQAMRDAGRAQLVAAMQQQAASWPAPSTDGRCALPSQAPLECDSDAIQQAIAPQAAVIAGLLDAWRSIEPATERLAIVFAQGRYQLTPIAAIATAALR
jgi:hypothetical protein